MKHPYIKVFQVPVVDAEWSFYIFQIILSLFVAVILDNLDLDEDIKCLKQVG